jgi:Rad3-related DNA helicase
MISRNSEMPDRIEFRWRQHEKEFIQRLADSARAAGRCPSEQARELLKDALSSSDEIKHAIEALQQEVAQLHHQLRHVAAIKEGVRAVHENIYQFRDDLAACAAKLLAEAGHLDSKAARDWVRHTFNAEQAAEE